MYNLDSFSGQTHAAARVDQVNAHNNRDWMSFLHALGTEAHKASRTDESRVAIFLSLPYLDYASCLISSGIIFSKYRNIKAPSASPEDWLTHRGSSVSFPFEPRNGKGEVKRKVGVVEGVEEGVKGRGSCLEVKYLDSDNGREYTRFVKHRWLPAIKKLAEAPNIDTVKHGSKMVDDIAALDRAIGENGASMLAGFSDKDCQIIDVNKRLKMELEARIPLVRLDGNPAHADTELLLADIVRPDSGMPQAMMDSYSARITRDPESGWAHTIICGSLNFLRCWDDCDSPVTVVLMSPMENAYAEALNFSNEIYYQRKEDMLLSHDLLASKPPFIDIHAIELD